METHTRKPTAYSAHDELLVNPNAEHRLGATKRQDEPDAAHWMPPAEVFGNVIVTLMPGHFADPGEGEEAEKQAEETGEKHDVDSSTTETDPPVSGPGLGVVQDPAYAASTQQQGWQRQQRQQRQQRRPDDDDDDAASGDWAPATGASSGNAPGDWATASGEDGGTASGDWGVIVGAGEEEEETQDGEQHGEVDGEQHGEVDGEQHGEVDGEQHQEMDEVYQPGHWPEVSDAHASSINGTFRADTGWPPRPGEKVTPWPAQAKWQAQARDPSKFVQKLRCRPPPPAPEHPPQAAVFGSIAPSGLDKPPKGEKKARKERPGDFANKYERETWYKQAELRKEREAEAEAERLAEQSKSAAAEWKRNNVRVYVQPDASCIEPYIELEWRASWNAPTQQHTVVASLRLPPAAFQPSRHPIEEDGDVLPAWALCEPEDATDPDGVENLRANTPLDAARFEAALPNLGSEAVDCWIRVDPTHAYGCKIFSDVPGAFGPHDPEFAALRPLLHAPFTISLLTPDGGRLRQALIRFAAAVDVHHTTSSALNKHWPDDKYITTSVKKEIPRLLRPRTIVRAEPVFANELHLATVEYFAASDATAAESDRSSKPTRMARGRIVLVPGGGTARAVTHFLVLVDMDGAENPCALRSGEPVKLRLRALNPKDERAKLLTGKVCEPPPFAHPGDAAIMVNTPRNPDSVDREHDTLDLTQLGGPALRSMEELTTAEQHVEAMSSQTAHLVDVHVNVDTRELKRTRKYVQSFVELVGREKAQDTEHGLSVTSETFCLGRVHLLPRCDVFADKREASVRAFLGAMTAHQREAVEPVCRNAAGNVVMVHGPAGSGKTEILALAVPVWTDVSQQVVMISSMNPLVDANTARIATMYPHLTVVRVMSADTERDIVKRQSPAMADLPGVRPGSLDQAARDEALEEAHAQLVSLAFGTALLDWHFEATLRPYRVRDSRVNEANLQYTVGWHVLLHCGLISKREPTTPEFRRLAQLIGQLIQLEKVLVDPKSSDADKADARARWTEDEGRELGQKIAEGGMYVIRTADVVVTTSALAPEWRIHAWLPNVGLVLIDEFPRIPSPHVLGLKAAFPGATIFATGDPKQLRPVNNTPAGYGVFTPQLSLPALSRFGLAGVPIATLLEQQRYPRSVCDLISELYYGGTLRLSGEFEPAPGAAERVALARSALRPECRANDNRVFAVNQADTAEQRVGATQSVFNEKLSAVCLQTAFDLIKNCKYEGRDIQIITGYTGQRGLTDTKRRALVAQLAGGDDAWVGTHLGEVTITTIDTAQGQQRAACIIDLVRSDGAGHMNNSNRLLTALSRLREIGFVVGDIEGIQKACRSDSPLVKLIDALKRRDAVIKLSEPMPIIFDDTKYVRVRDNTKFVPDGPGVTNGDGGAECPRLGSAPDYDGAQLQQVDDVDRAVGQQVDDDDQQGRGWSDGEEEVGVQAEPAQPEFDW